MIPEPLQDIEDPWGKCTRCSGSEHSGHDLGCPIGISKKEKEQHSENITAVFGAIGVILFFIALGAAVWFDFYSK